MAHQHRPHSQRRASTRRRWTIAAAATAAAVVGVGALVAGQASEPSQAAPTPASEINAPNSSGEVNAMGMPVLETPGTGADPKASGNVEVDYGLWQLGTVPLNTAIRPQWQLRNTGEEPVVIGEPRPEIREGCCPGPIELSTQTIPPGGVATLTFEPSMHPGMDGWHDIAIHVPLTSGADENILTLEVTGDFRDA